MKKTNIFLLATMFAGISVNAFAERLTINNKLDDGKYQASLDITAANSADYEENALTVYNSKGWGEAYAVPGTLTVNCLNPKT